jgi:hypothetical protein
MNYYRLYLLSRSDGHFIGCEELEALDDVEAVRLAERRRGTYGLELWCGKRRVKSFPAVPPPRDKRGPLREPCVP